MKKLRYHLVDVFTDRAFGGNQLAVFTDARGLSSEMMRTIAGELNLSEAAFVLPPEGGRNDYRVRIFTPAVELPMAGGSTIGAAFVLAVARWDVIWRAIERFPMMRTAQLNSSASKGSK